MRPAQERNTVGLLGFEARPVRIPYKRGIFRESLPVLRIEKIHPDSPGQELGLKTGDLLIAARLECEDPDAGWQPVSTMASLVSMVRGPGFETGSTNFWILRGEESLQGCIRFDHIDHFGDSGKASRIKLPDRIFKSSGVGINGADKFKGRRSQNNRYPIPSDSADTDHADAQKA